MTVRKIEKIQLDEYKELKNAERLNEIASGLAQETKRFEQSKNQLSRKWKGNAASEYITKMNRVEEEIWMHSREIRKVANQLQSIVARTRAAEKEANDVAQQRNYNR